MIEFLCLLFSVGVVFILSGVVTTVWAIFNCCPNDAPYEWVQRWLLSKYKIRVIIDYNTKNVIIQHLLVINKWRTYRWYPGVGESIQQCAVKGAEALWNDKQYIVQRLENEYSIISQWPLKVHTK